MPVAKIGLYSNNNNNDRRKTQEVAAGVGAAGYGGARISHMASKKDMLGTMMKNSSKVTRTAAHNVREASGIMAKFQKNFVKFTRDFVAGAMKYRNNKILGPIIRSKFLGGISSVFGGTMAFFVLITGLSKTANTAKTAFHDLKSGYAA